MSYKFRSILRPEGSIVSGIAVAGAVWAIYNMNVGNVSTAHASDPNHISNESSRKKAGYSAFIFVAGVTLITRDANVGLLGFASIVAMEINYRTAIMANPVNGQMVPPAGSSYQPASGQNVLAFSDAGANAPAQGYVGAVSQ
jgi:hypothetical protein